MTHLLNKKINFKYLYAVVAFVIFLFGFTSVSAATIDNTNKYARFEDGNYGLINFNPTNGNVVVNDSGLTGYVWGNYVGWINLSPTNGGVVNDGSGNLSGYAWGQNTGWINFNPTNGGVTIDSSGDFGGYAWSQNYGWIIFNCATDSSCGTFSHKVSTDWTATPTEACGNGLDDDSDGFTDYPNDPGCSSLTDTDETDTAGVAPPIIVIPIIPDPEIVDVCPNITGSQAVLPTGYQLDSFGNCFLPEVISDVCPNIPGDQESVPSGRVVDGYGNCIIPEDPVDLCPNIGGDQATIPSGMSRDGNGNCVSTPLLPPVEPPIIPPSAGGGGSAGGGSVVVPQSVSNVTKNLPLGIGNAVENVYVNVGTAVKSSVSVAQNIYKTPAGEATTKTITTTGVAVTVSSVFLNPSSLAEMALAPFRLWTLLLTFLGLRRKHKPWGTVYDSVTKQPLDPAYVTLMDENGKEITSAITDIDGRFGFLIEPGRYRMVANKTNYQFPSKRLDGKSSDELYSNLYSGELIEITDKSQVITKSIPMDPLKFDWNEFAKKNKKLMRFYSKFDYILAKISNTFFVVGFVIAIVALFIAPQPYNMITFGLYVLLIILRVVGLKPKPNGYLIDSKTGDPLSFAIVRVMSAELNVEIAHKIADKAGRYFCLVPKGKYYLKIEKKKQDESYELVHTTKVLNVRKGIINDRILISNNL